MNASDLYSGTEWDSDAEKNDEEPSEYRARIPPAVLEVCIAGVVSDVDPKTTSNVHMMYVYFACQESQHSDLQMIFI
jgi:hypothetical protein